MLNRQNPTVQSAARSNVVPPVHRRVYGALVAHRPPQTKAPGQTRPASSLGATADDQGQVDYVSRRAGLWLLVSSCCTPALPAAAEDGFGYDLARKLIRSTELTDAAAVAVLIDARSTLRDIAALAATAPDSEERFNGRKLWPGYAKWLREAGPAAPTVARLVTGNSDAEETLSSLYGGKADAPGVTDAVYQGLGQVLTISGRTIKPEAQASPERAVAAGAALDAFLAKVPKATYDEAQALRVARAQRLKQ